MVARSASRGQAQPRRRADPALAMRGLLWGALEQTTEIQADPMGEVQADLNDRSLALQAMLESALELESRVSERIDCIK